MHVPFGVSNGYCKNTHILKKYTGLGHLEWLGMGLTLACQRSTIIDSAVNEECGVYRLRAKERQ